MSTAGILVIGNEILTGKVRDENAPYLIQELRKNGVDVERVHIIPDIVDTIASEVREFSQRYDYVLTSGGVGPTHDDVTMESIAAAFDTKLVVHKRMEEMLREALKGQEPNASQMKMCELPAGASLIETPGLWFPLVFIENVYIFPGIPRLLQVKFEESRHRFVGVPVFLRKVFTQCVESDIAQALNELLEEFPELMLGSYPKIGNPDHRTMLTLESRDRDYVERAVVSLTARIPSEHLVRIE